MILSVIMGSKKLEIVLRKSEVGDDISFVIIDEWGCMNLLLHLGDK